MRHTGKRMEFCAKAAAGKREDVGDNSGGTDLEQVSLSLEEEENTKKQYTLTENGTDLWFGRTETRSTRTCHWLLLQGREEPLLENRKQTRTSL